jgi:hypothetical protein
MTSVQYDMSQYMDKKLVHFTGRRKVLDDIAEWIQRCDEGLKVGCPVENSAAAVMYGDPGTGESAFHFSSNPLPASL